MYDVAVLHAYILDLYHSYTIIPAPILGNQKMCQAAANGFKAKDRCKCPGEVKPQLENICLNDNRGTLSRSNFVSQLVCKGMLLLDELHLQAQYSML